MKNNLTLEQVREAEDAYEEAVRAAARAFEDATGLRLTSLGLHPDYRQVGSCYKFHLTAQGGGVNATLSFGDDNLPF